MEYIQGMKPLKGAGDWPMWKDCMLDFLGLFNIVDIIEGKREKPSLSKSPTKTKNEKLEKFNKSVSQAKIVISQ